MYAKVQKRQRDVLGVEVYCSLLVSCGVHVLVYYYYCTTSI